MWILMPSSAITAASHFFKFNDLQFLSDSLTTRLPVIKGRVWGGEERGQSWAVECEDFTGFADCVRRMVGQIQFLAYDEMSLDEDTLHLVQDDLYRFASEETILPDLVAKASAALRSHENEIYAVVAYAFLNSGQVLFVRAQTELARFVYHPDRLLSHEGISSVRKLRAHPNN